MDIDIAEKVEKGWVHLRFTIEIQGNNEEHIKKSLNKMVEAIGKKKFVILLKKKLDKMEEISDGWYSNFVEVEALIKGFDGLMEVATQFSPSTVEILAPKMISLPANELQNAMIDISSLISTFAHAAYLARRELKKNKKEE